jgi:hypothetical protein
MQKKKPIKRRQGKMANKIVMDAEHRYWNGATRIPGVSELIQSAGCSYLPDETGDALLSAIEDGLVDAEKYGIPGVPKGKVVEYIERAQRFGTAGHRATYLHDIGNLKKGALDVNLLPYLNHWRQFKKDYEFTMDAGEEIVFSEAWNFAGTLDRRGRTKKVKTIIDLKFTNKIQPSSELQLELYDIACGGGYRKLICQLSYEGYKVKEYKNPAIRSTAISVIQIFNWKRKNNLQGGW